MSGEWNVNVYVQMTEVYTQPTLSNTQLRCLEGVQGGG